MSMKAMETLHDLIEEAKLRTVWWTLCIFLVSYFLTHTSKSMWMNVPIALLLVSGVHILLNEVEFRWKIRKTNPHSYLSHLQKKQLAVNDSRLSMLPPPPKWKRKIESPVVEAAMEDFINKLLQEFVVDLWYSNITPDKEAPELIRAVIMDVLAEISTRVKDINLVDLLTRDVVDLIGDHLELFRRNHAAIGTDVMVTLSSEERDERLKHHLMDSKELHPALIAPESEYKFLKRIMGAVLAAVLRPREAQCPLVRCIARELLTCLVMEPVMRFASPGFINELIEAIFLASNNEGGTDAGDDPSSNVKAHNQNQTPATENIKTPESACMKNGPSCSQKNDNTSSPDNQKELLFNTPGPVGDEPMYGRSGDWARVFEAATQRRTEVLQPENLDMLWTRGRNYKKKSQKNAGQGLQPPILDGSGINKKELGKEISTKKLDTSPSISKNSVQMPPRPPTDGQRKDQNLDAVQSPDPSKTPGHKELDDDESSDVAKELVDENSDVSIGSKSKLKKSNSTSDLTKQSQTDPAPPNQVGGSIISEFYSADVDRQSDVSNVNVAFDKVLRIEGYVPRLKCRVLGAYFENLGSKSFAVYSIAVTDSDNKTWFVKRRYRNFERLHRHLKDIPNYTLQLPPKRIFSSSTEDAFVHQRCIQLDKYIQDLLSIANIAEQHEVWDFLSISSRNYSFGRSSSVMKALAVNVDDAVDDIVRQFKGVSDGLIRKVVGPNSPRDSSSSVTNRTVSPNSMSKQTALESGNDFSDNEEGDKDGTLQHEETESTEQTNGSHSDNELNSKGIPPRVLKSDEQNKSLDLEKKNSSEVRSEILSLAANFTSTSDQQEDPLGVPAEWTPANVSVPLLNLVDKIFQLKRRGWLRRQVFWISKQILQLMMEDAIDDWLLRQIHWLRRDEIVAQGIRWIQDVLWPEGTFFLKVNTQNKTDSSQSNQGSSRNAKQGSFQEQLEAARRASDIKKMIFNGAPTTLVSLIGRKQYKRCAKDMYYFLQSAVCLKQLGYGLLELVLITLFPELQDVILDVHGKKESQPL